jgi:hypothetical protein
MGPPDENLIFGSAYIVFRCCLYQVIFSYYYPIPVRRTCIILGWGEIKVLLLYSILFYSILLFSILFYSILFYSILFYSILFYSILFYSILFYSILFYFTPFYSTLFYSIMFYFYSMIVLYRRYGGVFYIIELELGENTTVPLLIFHSAPLYSPTVPGRFSRGSKRFAGSWSHAPPLYRVSGGFGRFSCGTRIFAVPLAASLACGSRRVRRSLAALRWPGGYGGAPVAFGRNPRGRRVSFGQTLRLWSVRPILAAQNSDL